MKKAGKQGHWWPYPLLLILLVGGWAWGMTHPQQPGNGWNGFQDRWPMSLTMLFGSLVAGSTPAGGGAVAYPVFTKIFDVSSPSARTFSLMIQSVGMSFAAFFILSRRISVSVGHLKPLLIGAVPGLLMGLHLPQTTSSLPRYAFTVTVFLFGLTLAYHHWHLRRAPLPAAKGVSGKDWGHLVIIGTLGGLVSSLFGSGADLFAYITLTLGFGLSERKAIPTTVLLMAILSIIGSADLVLRNHPTVAEVFPFWLVCVPVVAVGAPMGAWIAAHAARQHLIYGILFLIFLECASTALLLGWPSSPIPLLGFSLLSLGYFLFLLHQRHQLENTPSNRPLVSSES